MLAAFVRGVAHGSGIMTGMVLTFSAFAVFLAFVVPLAVKWIGRAL